MTASGLSAFQPPYFRPRAHTSVLFGRPCGAGGTAMRGAGGWGSGCGCGAALCGWRAAGAWGAAGAGTGVRCGAGALGDGFLDGPMSSSASRAGACTTCGPVLPSGRGGEGRDGAVGRVGAGGRWTVTQPERAAVATVARSVAAVVVRCTRSTLLRSAPFGERTSGGYPTRVMLPPLRRAPLSAR